MKILDDSSESESSSREERKSKSSKESTKTPELSEIDIVTVNSSREAARTSDAGQEELKDLLSFLK